MKTNLRELFVDEPHVDGTVVLLEKAPEDYVFLIGESGENILAVSKTVNGKVIVPFATYAGEERGVELAIQERLAALLWSAVVGRGVSGEMETVNKGDLLEHFKGKLKLHAIVANAPLAARLEGLGVPVFDAMNAIGGLDVAVGVVDPLSLGLIVTDSRVKPEHAKQWPFDGIAPGLVPKVCYVAMGLRQSGLVGVHVREEGVVRLACSRCGQEVSESYQAGRCYEEQCEPAEMDSHDEAEPWDVVHGTAKS